MPKLQPVTKCPHCGFPAFRSLTTGNEQPLVAAVNYTKSLPKPSVAIGSGWYSPAYVKRCDICGFLGFFDKQIVDDLL